MINEIRRPIENVVIITQIKNAIIGGIIIKNFSSSTVNPIIKQKTLQISKFTIVEYLNEVKINDFPFSIFL